MSANLVLATSDSDFASTAVGIDLPITLTSTHKVYAIVGINSSSVTPTFTQNNGGTVINTASRVDGYAASGQGLHVYELDATSGGNRVIVTTSAPFNIDAHFFIYTGMKSGVSFDKFSSSTGQLGLSRSTGMTPTLGQSEEVALVALYANGSFTVSATPWNNSYILAGTTSRVFSGYKHTSNTASTGSTGTLSSSTERFLSGVVATFKVDNANIFTDSDTVTLAETSGDPEINLGDPDSTLILDEIDEWEEDEGEPGVFLFDVDESFREEDYEWVEEEALTIVWLVSDSLALSDAETPDFEQTIPTDTDTILITDSDGDLSLIYSPPRVDPYPNTVPYQDPTWGPLQNSLLRHFTNDTRARNIYILTDDTVTDARPVDSATIRRILHAGHVHVVSVAEYEALRAGGFT